MSYEANAWRKIGAKVFIKDFFSKCDRIRSFLPIWLHLLKNSLMKTWFFVRRKLTPCEVSHICRYDFKRQFVHETVLIFLLCQSQNSALHFVELSNVENETEMIDKNKASEINDIPAKKTRKRCYFVHFVSQFQ